MGKQKLFFGGIPTDIDVAKLREAFGVPKEGQIITDAEIETVIQVEAGATRFRTVTSAWRKNLIREHNVWLKRRGGMFIVIDPPGMVDLGSLKMRMGVKSMRRAAVVVGATDLSRLTPQQRAQCDHIQMITATALGAARMKEIQEKTEIKASRLL